MNSKIKFFLILALIILGLAGYGYFKSTPGVENQVKNLPKIGITPPSFDFGEVEYGKVVEYTFKVRNSGPETLEIKRVATSCACTKANLKSQKANLKSGEETDLIVTYNTGLMSGSHAKGKQERIIYVKSNDPISPQVEVMIYADVK